MPRLARGCLKGGLHHVLNRGNHRQTLFHGPEEFAQFIELMAEGQRRHGIDLWGYCLMSNHWHVVVEVSRVQKLSQWVHWICNRHVRLFHRGRRLTRAYLHPSFLRGNCTCPLILLNLTLFRAYDPVPGRWLSRDPEGEGSDATLYSYVWNRPADWVDPLGLAGGGRGNPGSSWGNSIDPNDYLTNAAGDFGAVGTLVTIAGAIPGPQAPFVTGAGLGIAGLGAVFWLEMRIFFPPKPKGTCPSNG